MEKQWQLQASSPPVGILDSKHIVYVDTAVHYWETNVSSQTRANIKKWEQGNKRETEKSDKRLESFKD